MDVAGRNVVITGGAGFIGSHLADALVADNDVTVLDSLDAGDPANVPDDAALVEADVRDPDAVEACVAGTDLVFHQAALVSVETSVADPVASDDVTADGTLAVLEAARRHDARVVVASSAAIYGPPRELPVDETHPTMPESPYGVAKLAADHYARVYHELYGLETVLLRYFNVYGPRQSADYSAVIGTFAAQAAVGDPITVEGDGTQTRDFVHVSDVVRANLLAATADAGTVAGRPYNIGTGEETSIRQLAETVRELAESDGGIVHVEPREGDIDRSVADVSRGRSELGFEPTIPLREGLRDLLRVG